MYVWRVFFKMKVNTIAKKLKLRDHCMVLYAKKKVPEWLKYDCEFAEKVSPILDKCKECKCRVTEKPDRIS